MRAFVVDKAHIDLLVDVAIQGPRGLEVSPDSWYRPYVDWGEGEGSLHYGDEDRLGQLLVSENLRSIAYRYPDTLEGGDIPGPVYAYYVLPYRFRRCSYRLSVPEALAAIACYRYQACEHPEWKASAASRFLSRLEHSLIGTLTRDLPWHWTEETISKQTEKVISTKPAPPWSQVR